MNRFSFTQALLSFAMTCLGWLAACVPAHAGDRDIAEIQLRANGAAQRIEVDMNALAPGESRQLSADSGLPAIVTRTDEGLRVEIAGEVREIKMPRVGMHAHGEPGEGRKLVIKRKHEHSGDAAGDGERKVVRIVHRSHEGDDVDQAEIDAMMADALAEAGAGEVEGDQVRVIRRIEREKQD